MHLEFLKHVFKDAATKEAVIWHDQSYSYSWLLDEWLNIEQTLAEIGIGKGKIVGLEADFSPKAIALLLALIDNNNIIVPLSNSIEEKKPEFRKTAEVEIVVTINEVDGFSVAETGLLAAHPLLCELKDLGAPGLVLFSSGSTGTSKAALHDVLPMLEKFKVKRHSLRAITFLLFDHIGGINTLLYNLSNAGCTVTVSDRRPESICRTVEKHHVELLPTSPTFINLLLVSEAYKNHNLDSLKMITYGTEVMPESTLEKFHSLYPEIKLLQTYGLSEVGILRSKSKSSDSLWVKIGGEGFETRVVDGMLEIKAKSAMRGYLNSPSPFTSDGWFITGDAVEVDGEYFKILGRKSELINVGGEKVYPAEVESVLQLMDGVEEISVRGEKHPMTGQIVAARIRLSTQESLKEFKGRMFEYCRSKLDRFKIPQKVTLVENSLHGQRYKKLRN